MAQNRIEQQFATQCRAMRLPAFELEYRFAPPRMFRSDFAWPQYQLLVEIQGGIWMAKGAHSRPANIVRDIEKAQLAVQLGFSLLPVTVAQVKSGEAIRLVVRVLAAKGWTDEPRRA